MSYLSMMEAKLPPGFRFHPRDEELVCDYLEKKISGDHSLSLYGCPTMIDVDLNKCEPWDLPEVARVGGKEWYFFSLRDRKYATGQRTNRATVSGYWKATGKDRHVVTQKGHLVGMRKTLVFYQGRAPKGSKTDWVMHEFRYEPRGADVSRSSVKQEDWALCRVFYKSRGHPSNNKISMAANYEEDTSSSSSLLPPLTMETAYINFGRTQMKNLEEEEFDGYYDYEQVPCFSDTYPTMPPAATMPIMINPTHLEGLPELASVGVNHFDNNKVIRAVLNHLTKLETDTTPPSLGEGKIIDHSYFLPKNGLSPMW